MKTILSIAMLALFVPCALAAGAADKRENQQSIAARYRLHGDARQFSIQYTGRVSEIPAGAKRLRVWLPVPPNSTVQEISKLEFTPSAKLAVEPKYGNRVAYLEMNNPGTAAEIKMSFVCKRDEIRLDLANLKEDGKDPVNAFVVFKNPDKLVLVDDEMKTLSDRITLGKTGTQAKARAIYDYVLEKMTYDKNHTGWGLGSTRHACDVGKGNCTDFHALFNSLCRAQGIASGFEIGLYLPYERNKQETLGGYHCWGFFRVPGKTWVPVDCSEADRFPERKEYFFGNHTSNRVTLSTGRDLVLEPKQEGPPLNYFLNPYAEADGKPVKTEKTWAYQDIN
jgi:transglutaminase-like putative cysteine protease